MDGGNTPPITRKDLPPSEEGAVYHTHDIPLSPRMNAAQFMNIRERIACCLAHIRTSRFRFLILLRLHEHGVWRTFGGLMVRMDFNAILMHST